MTIRKFLRPLVSALLLTLAAVQANAALVVGGKNFTEQQILASMTAQYLSNKGFDIDLRAGMGTAVLRKAQINGQIDLYWEYTGTALINFNKIKDRLSPEETYQRVKHLDAERGLVWLNPSRANNTYALAMQRSEAEARNIHTISDLAKAVNAGEDLRFACNAEFAARADGLRPLQQAYGFKFPRAKVDRMDSGLTYQALKEGQVSLALVFATDGRIPAFDFITLKDDKNYFPTYALTPVIRQATLKQNPQVGVLLNQLSAQLDDQVMSRLNAEVDVSKKTIEQVAKQFLQQQGLI